MSELRKSFMTFFDSGKCQHDRCPVTHRMHGSQSGTSHALPWSWQWLFVSDCGMEWNMGPAFQAQNKSCIYGVISCLKEVQNNSLCWWSVVHSFLGHPRRFVAGLFGGWNHQCYAVLWHTVEIEKGNLISRSGILMLDENAKPYSAMVTENHIAILVWEHLHHMPYSSDLKLSDFHQFPAFKKNLGRRCFGNNAEVKQAIKWFFHIQTLSLFWRAFWSLSNSMTNVSMYLVLT